MTPRQRYEILKSLTMKSCLPLRSLGEEGRGEWRLFFHSTCPARCALRGGGGTGRCDHPGASRTPAFTRTSPVSAHTPPTAGRPPAFCANALSIQQAPQEPPGKGRHTIFLPRLIFTQGCLSHTTTLEGCDATSVQSVQFLP